MALSSLKPSLSGSLTAAVTLSIFVNIIGLFWQLSIINHREPNYSYVGNDMSRTLPIKQRLVNMNFSDDPKHYAMTGGAAWAEWNALRPPGAGFAFLGDAYYPFDVSMFHQLHCLNHIRYVLVNGDDGSDHVEHCFHYIRQAIMCASDITLEVGGIAKVFENGDMGAPGSEMTHTCKDWRQVYEWLDERQEDWTAEQRERYKEPSDGSNYWSIHDGHGAYTEEWKKGEGLKFHPPKTERGSCSSC